MTRRRRRIAVGVALLTVVSLVGLGYQGVLRIREDADRMKDT